MQRTEIINRVASIKNGTYQKIAFMSDITPNKDNKDHRIQRMVSAVVRLGVAYSHIQLESIQNRNTVSENGQLVTEQLPWGTWDIDCPYLIEHKGNYYLRCTASRSPNHHRHVRYFLDGVEVTKEDLIPLTRPSEWTPKAEEVVFNPKIENIISLGKEAK